LEKAKEGLSTRTTGLVPGAISLEVITAEALVALSKDSYFGLERKVISPSFASFMPHMPLITISGLPKSSPFIAFAISPSNIFTAVKLRFEVEKYPSFGNLCLLSDNRAKKEAISYRNY
jgi:hypothetical protein